MAPTRSTYVDGGLGTNAHVRRRLLLEQTVDTADRELAGWEGARRASVPVMVW